MADYESVDAPVLGRNVNIIAKDQVFGRNVHIGDNVTIRARRLKLENDVRIGKDVEVSADVFEVGHGTCVEDRCMITGPGGRAQFVQIGEQSFLGHDTKVSLPVAVIGDYTDIHNHGLLYGRKTLVIGHNCWFGQNNILNAEDYLTIGNNAGIGIYTSVFTHGYFGDLLEGCQLCKIAPVVIEDDVWILGAYNTISPGITLGEKSLILNGSVVTRDVPPNHTFGGQPARDLTDRFVPYQPVPPAVKLDRIETFIVEFLETQHRGCYDRVDNGFLVEDAQQPYRIMFVAEVVDIAQLPPDRPLLVFTLSWNASLSPPRGVTILNLVERQYMRTRSVPEVCVLRFLKSYRARFVPADNPRVRLPQEFV